MFSQPQMARKGILHQGPIVRIELLTARHFARHAGTGHIVGQKSFQIICAPNRIEGAAERLSGDAGTQSGDIVRHRLGCGQQQ